jgi:hypothetical protein
MLGIGRSFEAAFTLLGPIPAGTWHLVGDGYLLRKRTDVRFDIIWRDAAKKDTVLATAMNTFVEPLTNHDNAVAYDADIPGIAASAKAGDKLVLKFTVVSGDVGGNYTPDGDGPIPLGRYPNLTLPQ